MANHAKTLMRASVVAALAAMAAMPLTAQAQDNMDMDHIDSESVPGNAALDRGNIAEAITMLEAARLNEGNDPAILINLGQAYARAGDREKARSLFIKARDSRRGYDMVLSNGDVVSSRQAAIAALEWLDRTRATAQLDR
ncbi:MAG: tetratricopeptide repeat protein [Pseudomonadota bacterium]